MHSNSRERKQSVWPLRIQEQGSFFVGGSYDETANPMYMTGQMYVRYQIPARPASSGGRYPVVMVHGGGQQGTNFTGTPDGRPGWADYFLKKGWPVYVIDQPGRGKSPYFERDYGPKAPPDIPQVEERFTAVAPAMKWPQAALHTQWPGSGVHGDPVFDQFMASQYKGMERSLQEKHSVRTLIALLDRIGPAVLLTHSQSGPYGWCVADARPHLVKAVLAVEPNGPLFHDTESPEERIERPWGLSREPLTFDPPLTDPGELDVVQQDFPDAPELFRIWLQREPARRLPRLAGIPILILTGEASYHAQYDHGASRFLTQAGVENEHVCLKDVGMHGNGHMMMLEKNNLDIATLMEKWLRRKLQHRPAMHDRSAR